MQKTIVVSPQALEGIAARDGNELLVADGAGQFIDQLGKVLDAPQSRALGLAARARILADYSWESNLSRLSAILAHASEPLRHAAEHVK